jgi:hypothetical protein
MLEYIYMAIDDFNTRPPVTGIILDDLFASMGRWKTAILLRSAAFACFAIAMNWIADEFSIGEEEKLKIRVEGKNETCITIGELFALLYEESIKKGRKLARKGMKKLGVDNFPQETVTPERLDSESLKDAYKNKKLLIQSMNNDGSITWSPIEKVMRHDYPSKKILRISTDQGPFVVVTEDHSLFSWDTKAAIKASEIYPGYPLIGVIGEELRPMIATKIEFLNPRQYMYDLSIPYNENFFLESGLLAHNSYSISGVSLDIEKSSKYQSMKDEYISEYDKVLEAAKRSIKIIVGLRQFRYGIGITSALGPLSRPGIQSRRNFIEGGGPSWS